MHLLTTGWTTNNALQPTRAAEPKGQRERRVPARAAERQRYADGRTPSLDVTRPSRSGVGTTDAYGASNRRR